MTDTVDSLVQQLHGVTRDVEAAFGGLTAAQLNWKPGPSEWSIAQCLEHLIAINSSYFPTFERIERGEFTPTLKERLPLLPGLFGRLILASVRPEARRRVRTSPKFEPSSSAVPADIVTAFGRHQEDVARHMQAMAGLDPGSLVITSPVAGAVTYSVLDALRILVAHEQRHLAQARRVKASPEFPEVRGS